MGRLSCDPLVPMGLHGTFMFVATKLEPDVEVQLVTPQKHCSVVDRYLPQTMYLLLGELSPADRTALSYIEPITLKHVTMLAENVFVFSRFENQQDIQSFIDLYKEFNSQPHRKIKGLDSAVTTDRIRKALRGQLATIVGTKKESLKKQLQQKQLLLTMTENAAQEYRAQVANLEMQVNQFEKLYLEACDERVSRTLLEIDRLLTGGTYSSVEFKMDGVVAKTTEVVIPAPKQNGEYHMGVYVVHLKYNGAIEFRKADDIRPNDGSGYIHPHIDQSGRPCLGNIQTSLTELVAQVEYSAALQVIFRYLCSYNADSPHYHIERWDKVKKPMTKPQKEGIAA